VLNELYGNWEKFGEDFCFVINVACLNPSPWILSVLKFEINHSVNCNASVKSHR